MNCCLLLSTKSSFLLPSWNVQDQPRSVGRMSSLSHHLTHSTFPQTSQRLSLSPPPPRQQQRPLPVPLPPHLLLLRVILGSRITNRFCSETR